MTNELSKKQRTVCLKLTERIENAIQYLRAQRDVDPESGKIFIPVPTARYIILSEMDIFPGHMSIHDPLLCGEENVRWFGCKVIFNWLTQKATVQFCQKRTPSIIRKNNGVYVKVPGTQNRICIDIPVPEDLQK